MESKEVRGLMEAYSSVYEQSMLDTVVDTATSAVKPPVQRQANKKYGPLGGYVAGREVDKIGNQVKSGDYGGALNRAVQGAGKLFNSVDMFDIVKGHLLDEGYADTEEAALAIMANMSEEWKQSIVEAPGEWFGGLRDKARASRSAQMQSSQQTPKPLPSTPSPFAKPASKDDSGKLTTYGAGGGAEAERRGQTRAQVMQQGAKNLENKKRAQPVNQGPDFGR